jgi:glycosyltransferase involved in cell wall biosynthesis
MPFTVTIGIPCYNAAQWIAAAVQSALDQTWANKEVIVVDDGSTDTTLDELRQFANSIRVMKGPHEGPNHARNLILRAARGEWIQYLDADDYLRKEKIARQFEEAGRGAEEADVIYSPVLLETWRDGRALPPVAERLDAEADVYTQLLRWELPQTGGALWRKAALLKIGGWEENRTQLCDEHNCYVRALKAQCGFVYAPTPNAVYRIWSEETRCRRDQRPVIKSRTKLCESLRDWLKARGMWTQAHREALGQSLLEMARKLASEDLSFATRYHEAHKEEIWLEGPAAPKGYQLIYKTLGFRAAERVGRALR